MFGLGPTEIVVIVVVAILIFGPRLPQVAAEAAGWIMKLKRSMSDLRRDSGIDREFSEVRRQVENAVPRELRNFDPARSVQTGMETLKHDVAEPVVKELRSAHDALMDDRREPIGPAAVPSAVTAPDPGLGAPPAAEDPLP